jgi:hypothetical protein
MEDELTLPDQPEDEVSTPDVEPSYGPVTRFEGRYEVDPIPGGKRFQGTWLVQEDGVRYVMSYRPVPEYFPYADKRVIVIGRPYQPGRDTQHMLAAHLQVLSIELAPGEISDTDIPTELPAPPLLRTAEDVFMRDGKWGQIVGRLVALEDDPDTDFSTAYIQLEDGTHLTARYAAPSQWQSYLGSTLTVMSRIEVVASHQNSADAKRKVVLTGWYAVCPGVVDRCGM